MSMSSSRPYLIRALHEWIVANNCTPHVAVDAYASEVEVPQDFVRNGQIVLNIAPSAVRDLVFSDEQFFFNARFNGIPTDIVVPYAAVVGIYAKENGQGMMFDTETSPEPPEPSGPKPVKSKSNKGEKAASGKADSKPQLRVVK